MARAIMLATILLCLSIFLVEESEAAPSNGTIEVAFILSEFSNQEFQSGHDKDYFENLAFGETNSVWEYYDEVSRGMLNIEGDVYGPYELTGNAEDYGEENLNFVSTSVDAADDYIDYRNYDAVVVIHSGPGEESSSNENDIWSIHWPSANIATDDDGYVIKRITQAPEYQSTSAGEKNPLGVWCHEFGHELGLPDLYDTDGSSAGIGDWGIMASGSWTDYGETPAYFSAWSRIWLGWIEPVIITDDINNLELEPIENSGNVYLLPIPGNWSSSDEYYLLENRQQIGYDSHLPGEGMLIWHIDEDVLNSNWNSNSVNNDEDHKGVDLEEADGDDDLDSKTNYGDSEDPYNSGSFAKDTYPNSLAYNGTESGWKIENIETSGDNVIIDISFLSKPHAVADADEAVITEGSELQFYGNESWDEDGNIVNFTWNFGDGNYAYIDNPTYIFTENGSYDVVLTVCDNNDLCDSMTLNIFVNKPPIAVVEISNLTVFLGDKIIFNASGSYDIDGSVEFYYWNFDDGYTSNQAQTEHEYKNSGTYNVSLKLFDDLNDITTVYYSILVINQLPVVAFEFSPDTGDTMITFNFNDLSYDNDGNIEEWEWDFADGTVSNLQSPSHQFSLPGAYNVKLTVSDDQGGANTSSSIIIVDNSPPNPEISIVDGFLTGSNQWMVASDKPIEIDATVTFDNENDNLTFYWTFVDEELTGEKQNYIFPEGENELTLRVIDERGDETTETFSIIAESIPILFLDQAEIDLVVNQNIILDAKNNWGLLNLYKWEIVDEDLLDGSGKGTQIYNQTIQEKNLNISFEKSGNYKLYVSGRDSESNLWTKAFSQIITVYNNPNAKFEFNEEVNEGEWIVFDGKKSTGLGITFSWTLDGKQIAGESEMIDILIDTGGNHTVGLTVNQDPVGSSYIQKDFYANYKPTSILSTNPSIPRYGEDFEVYLAAYDVETDATIEYLNISVYNNNGNKAWGQLYQNQGSNFNIVFEMQYIGEIIVDYKIVDEDGNIKEASKSVNVLGWADIYVESFEISGDKEKGKKQSISVTLANYNEIYQSELYNGQTAEGTLELLINSEVIHTWKYQINPAESEEFKFEWTATTGYYIFEVKATVIDGETIIDNNEMNLTVTIEAERESGFLSSLNSLITLTTLIIIANILRRKAN